MVARSVGTGDSGPIEHEGDPGLVQGDIHQHLVEGTVYEGRVERDHRMQAPERHPGRRRDSVLLGDTDIQHPVRILLRELVQARRAEHGGGDAHDRGVLVGEVHDLIGEHRGPRGCHGR